MRPDKPLKPDHPGHPLRPEQPGLPSKASPFVWESQVYFDEFDPNGVLHNSRFAVHVERALTAWYAAQGRESKEPADRHEDLVYAVREFTAEFLAPVTAPGTMRVELWLERVGQTSAVHQWRCAVGPVTVARGRRVIVKIDPRSGAARPWTGWFRALAPSEV